MRQTLTLFLLALSGAAAAFAQNVVPLNPAPSRIIGHALPEVFTINSSAPNLVEGRELFQPQGIALDTSVTPPIVYVSDTGNHRILAWKNATSFQNGQTADLVIGQPDLYRTNAGGPSVASSSFSAGLNSPSGIAVYKGDLYVADNLNNRVLRFPKPFSNIGNQFPDLYIGQPNLSSARANYTGVIDRQGVSLAANSTNIAFDASGNLWMTDPGNRRVLQFLASDVAAGGGPLRASLVIGQPDFATLQAAVGTNTRTKNDGFAVPSSLAFEPASGRLFVTDSGVGGATAVLSRVLVFNPPFSNGMAATRIMGVFPGNPPSQDAIDRTVMAGPEGVFFMPENSKMGVVDSGSNRILIFDSYDKWPDQNTTFSPLANDVVGQADLHRRGNNRGPGGYLAPASASGLNGPTAVAFTGTELFVVDNFNNRVVVLPFTAGKFGAATRVLGQDYFYGQSVNLIEGREFQFNGTNGDAGLAIDNSGDTPHLYVADTYNNRVLGFRDMRKVQAGTKADLVIGQSDFTTGLLNFQGLNNPDTGNPDKNTSFGLNSPSGLAVDSAGNLYVADTGNSRVLRFPAPFDHQTTLPEADLVLGQRNFMTVITDPSSSTMSAPYGLAIVNHYGLLVSDIKHHRVLYFPFTAGETFTAGADNGRGASKVFGQPDFFSVTSGAADTKMSQPHHVATDSEARIYVADTGNNRVLIFDQVTTTAAAGAPAARILTGFGAPHSVYVNSFTDEIWVGDGSTMVKKYPRFTSLIINSSSNGSVASLNGLALAQDNLGNLAVADASSRVAFYFQGLQVVNGASFLTNRPVAPGTFASICSPNSGCSNGISEFGGTTAVFSSLPNPIPYPTTLGDVQVLFNGKPAPLTYVSPTQINFVVPMSAPSSGTADVMVVQASTGRVYGAGTASMNTYSPAIFTLDYPAGNRRAAVLNQDQTVNAPNNCADRGSYITIYATGQGFIENAPPDGAPPQGLVGTPFTPRVFINFDYTDAMALEPGEPKNVVQFSGLSQYPGLWQVNAYVPKVVGIGSQVNIVLTAGSSSSIDANSGFRTVICIK
jgi:uncharacterized protein (TIGR03437 family)